MLHESKKITKQYKQRSKKEDKDRIYDVPSKINTPLIRDGRNRIICRRDGVLRWKVQWSVASSACIFHAVFTFAC